MINEPHFVIPIYLYAHFPPTAMMQFLEVVRIEGNAFPPDDVALACDMYLMQVKSFLCLCLGCWFSYLIKAGTSYCE